MAGYSDNPSALLHAGKYTNGDPVAGVPASIILAEQTNNLVDEINNVLAAAGIAPVFAQSNQLATAVAELIQNHTRNRMVAAFGQIYFAATPVIYNSHNIVSVERLGSGVGFHYFRVYLNPAIDWDLEHAVGQHSSGLAIGYGDIHVDVYSGNNAGKYLDLRGRLSGATDNLSIFSAILMVLHRED